MYLYFASLFSVYLACAAYDIRWYVKRFRIISSIIFRLSMRLHT